MSQNDWWDGWENPTDKEKLAITVSELYRHLPSIRMAMIFIRKYIEIGCPTDASVNINHWLDAIDNSVEHLEILKTEFLLKQVNVFTIPRPHEWSCRIIDFSDGHKIMVIELTNINDHTKHMTLRFRKVSVFSGSTTWREAAFHIASIDEMINFAVNTLMIRDPDEIKKTVDGWQMSNLTLFVCSSSNIYILANAGTLVDEQGNEIHVPQPG